MARLGVASAWFAESPTLKAHGAIDSLKSTSGRIECVAGAMSLKIVNNTNFRPVIKRMDTHFKNGGKVLLLDFDRVLGNSDAANATSILMLMEEYCLKPRNMTAKKFLDMCSGISAREILLGLSPNLRHEPALLDEMLGRLAKIAATNVHMIEKTPIAADYLPEVKDKWKGAQIVLNTNRKKIALQPALDHLAMHGLFDHVLYQSRIMPPKPASDMFMWSMKLTKSEPEKALLIDDNITCIIAARLLGIPAKQVIWKADASGFSLKRLLG